MNHPVPLRRLGAGLMLASLLLSLTACQPMIRAIRPSEAETAAAPPTADTAEESLRAYYETLISDLRQALLNAKQSDYMTRREYESRIAELESRLSDQQALPTEPPDGTDLWVSVPPVQPPAETEADLERKKAADGIKREIVEVSGALTEKMLEREINTDDHRALIDSFIEEIGEVND